MSLKKDIIDSFQNIDNQNYGAKFYKTDLHFHTPASQDARGRNRYGFNPYNIRYPKTDHPDYHQLLTKKQESIVHEAKKLARDIVQTFLDQSLSLVAITDHNSLGTVYKDAEARKTMMDLAAPSWYELIDDAARKVNAAAQRTLLTILPGVEISTSGSHILGIFEPQVPRRKIHFIICDLLNEAGFSIEDFGKNPEVGFASVYDTIELIIKKGGIPIPAHIDGSDQAMLKLYKINSGAMKNLLTNKHLNAVEIVNPSKLIRKDRKLKQSLYSWIKDIRKDNNLLYLSYFQGSDAHDLKSVAKRHTMIKMTEPTFSGLKTAIKMPSSRIRISGFNTVKTEGLFVWGIHTQGGFRSKERIRFNRHLNCVVGKKETGKTLLFQAMQSALCADFKEINQTFTEVILFVEKIIDNQSSFYAFIRQKSILRLFQIDPEKMDANEMDISQADKLEIKPEFYRAAKINIIIRSKPHLHDFLEKHFGRPTKTNIRRFNKQFAIAHFMEKEHEVLLTANQIDGQYHLKLNINFQKGKPKMVDFFSLTSSLKRSVIFCIIIMMNRFGPAIFDAPEYEFDNSDITNFLVPVIKKYKDSQQIILFSNSSILAVNADTDNFVLLDKKTVSSGFAIDSRQNLADLMNIIEGSPQSFYKRHMKYDL
jgi:hypothetical protein